MRSRAGAVLARNGSTRGSPRLLLHAAVLGAGHGGLALTAYLAWRGVPVRLWNRSRGPLVAVADQGGIRFGYGGRISLVRPLLASDDPGEVLAGAQVVLVAVPAAAHRDVVRAIAPHLEDGQVVLLLPGRTGGAFEFRQELARCGCRAQVLVGEAATFPFASRVPQPGCAVIHGVKRAVRVAALPASRTAELLKACRALLPMLQPAPSVLDTSLDNMGAVLHPAIALLNAGRIEAESGRFRFYAEGVTPAVARVIEAVDAERLRVAAAYGVRARPLPAWVAESYGLRGGVREVLAGNPAYRDIAAPPALDHRYLWEDVPTGLVPLAELGRAAGVATPVVDGLIALASAVHGRDYRAEGRTLERLGLRGMGPAEVAEYAREGRRAACASA